MQGLLYYTTRSECKSADATGADRPGRIHAVVVRSWSDMTSSMFCHSSAFSVRDWSSSQGGGKRGACHVVNMKIKNAP
jgi:hypothetical protein